MRIGLPIVAWLCLLLAPAWLAAAVKQRYVAVFRDGSVTASNDPPSWHETASGANFGGRLLFDPKNEALLLRDRTIKPALRPPYIVMANGDVVPGIVTGYQSSHPRHGERPALLISPDAPLDAWQGEHLTVRADRVERIVTTHAALSVATDNSVLLVDGRRFHPRSLRWTPYGLAMLTDKGVVNVNFVEIADACLAVDRTQATIEDGLAAGHRGDNHLVRLTTLEGAVLTGSRTIRYRKHASGRRSRDSSAHWIVTLQPAWALDGVSVLESSLCQSSFRKTNELPLSQLTSSGSSQKSAIAPPLRWQQNRSVQGAPLASGPIEADCGLGTHAHSEVAFALPAQARTLSLWVGLERAVGTGGCVICKIRRDSANGAELWSSGPLRGSDGPRRVQAIDVRGAKQVVLVTEMCHTERPAGADPLDIRDDVVWLSPLVTVDANELLTPTLVAEYLGNVRDWNINAADLKDIAFATVWNSAGNRWDANLLRVSEGKQLSFRRHMSITSANDVLEFVTAVPLRPEDQEFEVRVDGQKLTWSCSVDREHASSIAQRSQNVSPRMGLPPKNENPHESIYYWWDLQSFRGREVTIEFCIKGTKGGTDINWRSLSLRNALANLPKSGRLPQPSILLTSLLPVEASAPRGAPTADRLPTRHKPPLTFRGQTYTGGYGMVRSSKVTFTVPADHNTFVALAGTCIGSAGPLRVLLDDRVAWESPTRSAAEGAVFIELALPAGTERLTLESGNEGNYYGYGAFAHAGFVR